MCNVCLKQLEHTQRDNAEMYQIILEKWQRKYKHSAGPIFKVPTYSELVDLL